jgi:hypothetical protein
MLTAVTVTAVTTTATATVVAATATVAEKNNNQLKPATEKRQRRSMQPSPQSF